MTTVDIENVTPTVAVGIGWAGCSMISTLHDLAREENIEEKFRFVGIDTNTDDLRANIDFEANEVTRFELDTPEQWDDNKDEYDFLYPNLLPGGERQLEKRGALRKRRIGRYYVDSHRNFEDLRTHLLGVIDEFADTYDDFIERQGNTMNIWVMNSLSGGTGSGSFPIVSTMLSEITKNAAWSPGDFTIFGLGALPNLDEVTEDYITYQLNTYAALRDIRVLIGEDDNANKAIRLGEKRSGVENDDRLELEGYVFDRYFLQPFDQDEMASDAYKYQLNKASASVPLYFALIEGQENWPEQIMETVNERLYTFDTYELSVPAENAYRYFITADRISLLESEIAELESEKGRVTNDLEYLDEVTQVDIDGYIQEYCDERGEDESEARLTEIIPEEVELPDRIAYDMVETAKGAVGGLSLNRPNVDVDEVIEERYDSDWDDTDTDDVDHREVFAYVLYQMVARKIKEEKRTHRLHEVVASTWEKYHDELMGEYSWLDPKDAPTKWRDGLEKFLTEKIEKQERELPKEPVLLGGVSLFITILFLGTWWLNIAFVASIAGASFPAMPLSVGGVLLILLAIFVVGPFGYSAIKFLKLNEIRNDKKECERAYGDYNRLESIEEVMKNNLDRLELGADQLEQRKKNLETAISQKETVLENQQTLQAKVEDRLAEFKFEFDRKIPLPIRNTDNLKVPGIENKIREYVPNHPSINLEVVNREVFDVDVEMEVEDEPEQRVSHPDHEGPDSIRWFTDRDLIDETDISRALNEILREDQRLAECPLRHYTNHDPNVDEILQYVWNPINDSIKEAEGGGEKYATLANNYDTNQLDGEIADEFRVWMMGVYTNFYLENMALYADLNRWYTTSDDGDSRVAEEFDLDADPNFVTSRFAYPEFYTAPSLPIEEESES